MTADLENCLIRLAWFDWSLNPPEFYNTARTHAALPCAASRTGLSSRYKFEVV